MGAASGSCKQGLVALYMIAEVDVDIIIADYPQLALLCWNLPGVQTISEERALAIYEERWRHLDEAALTKEEQDLIKRLADEHGGGALCV